MSFLYFLPLCRFLFTHISSFGFFLMIGRQFLMSFFSTSFQYYLTFIHYFSLNMQSDRQKFSSTSLNQILVMKLQLNLLKILKSMESSKQIHKDSIKGECKSIPLANSIAFGYLIVFLEEVNYIINIIQIQKEVPKKNDLQTQIINEKQQGKKGQYKTIQESDDISLQTVEKTHHNLYFIFFFFNKRQIQNSIEEVIYWREGSSETMQMKQMKYSQPIQKVQYGGVIGQVPRPSTEGKFASHEPYLKMSGMGQPLSPKMHPPFVTSTMVPEGAETRPSTHLQVPMRQLKTQYSQSQLHHTHLPETSYLGPRSSHSQLHRAPESRIEYVPYESYYIDYEERPMITSVRVPVQRKYTDYYTVQHITEYVPREIEEKHIEMVQEEIIRKKVFYTPVQTHIVHFPEDKLQNTNYKSKQVEQEPKINVCQVSIPNRSGEHLDQPEIYEK